MDQNLMLKRGTVMSVINTYISKELSRKSDILYSKAYTRGWSDKWLSNISEKLLFISQHSLLDRNTWADFGDAPPFFF